MAQIKFTYSLASLSFFKRRDEGYEAEYLGTYDMVKNTISEETINEAMKNAGQWVEINYKVTKTEVHPGKIGSIKGWVFDVYYGGNSYPNIASAVYKTRPEAQVALDEYLKTGKLEFYGSAETEVKKKGRHLGSSEKKSSRHLSKETISVKESKKSKHLGESTSSSEKDKLAREIESTLPQFSGSENWYKHSLSGYTYTDGVKYLGEKAEAYWLVDKILLTMKHEPKLQLQDYQEFTAWRLELNTDLSATLTAEDGNRHKLYSEKIVYTDFPLKEISLWFENGVLILPSEH